MSMVVVVACQGAFWVYRRDKKGVWKETQGPIQVQNPVNGVRFGYRYALIVVVVGDSSAGTLMVQKWPRPSHSLT